MNPARFQILATRYRELQIAVIGDFCLDRYLEIDPARRESSIETGLPVHNVIAVRAQPGGAGTILNNLVALGIGSLHPVGFCGVDGEGFELQSALRKMPGVSLEHFLETGLRRTFTYCKPLVLEPGQPPRELSRLDSKNWTPTPPEVASALAAAVSDLAARMDALVLLDQVDLPETGVLCAPVLAAVKAVTQTHPKLPAIADSRRSLRGFPPVIFKMNRQEFTALTGLEAGAADARFKAELARFARQLGQPVFVTAAERGIFGATPDGQIEHQPALPVRGPIDIVGAGDAVTANLIAALAAGASLGEAIAIANAAASVVIHKLGTTGTASPGEILHLLPHE